MSVFPKIRRNIFVIKCKLIKIDASGHLHNKLIYFWSKILYKSIIEHKKGKLFYQQQFNVYELCNWPLNVKRKISKKHFLLNYQIDKDFTKRLNLRDLKNLFIPLK